MKKNRYYYQDLLLKRFNPKIAQKIKLLRLNEDFIQDIKSLRKKWSKLIKEVNILYKKKLNAEKKLRIKPTLNNKKLYISLLIKENSLLINRDFTQDLIEVAKKHRLYPLNLWRLTLQEIVCFDFWVPLLPLFDLPWDANFALHIKQNEITKELELYIHVFDDTTIRDIKKYWKYIKKWQDVLLKNKKIIRKRYYPLKNLEIAEKLFGLKKQNLDFWRIQERIYGEIGDLNFGKEERKRINRLKQICYQYKKRIG